MGLRGRKNITDTTGVFFVTTTLVNHEKIICYGRVYQNILRDALIFVLKKYRVELYAYVFMPSHIHFVAAFEDGRNLSNFMRDFKKFTSTIIRQQLEKDGKLDVIMRLRAYAAGRKNQVFKLWMDRFDDFVIETEKMLIVKVEYIHNNPVKAGLVADANKWEFSSARNYSGYSDCFMKVNTDWA